MPLTVVSHPLAQHYLTHLRDAATNPAQFRVLSRKLATLLVIEATAGLRTRTIQVRTPLATIKSQVLAEELVAVPILRAGLGMLDAVTDLFPDVSVGYIGLERDESTAEASCYYRKLPALAGRTVVLLDPMLATGGSAERALVDIYAQAPERVILVCVVAAPE